MDTYALLLSHKLTVSRRHASVEWFGCAPNYLALNNGISESAVLTVIRRLWMQGHWLLALRLLHQLVFECGEFTDGWTDA